MKILVTGSEGFIAKNLISFLETNNIGTILKYSKNDSLVILEEYLKNADFIFHLAGVNRPKNISEFYDGNSELTKNIVGLLVKYDKKIPIVFSSSTQASQDNDYGKSKLNAEKVLIDYQTKAGANVFIFRLPNVFGRWAKPNYNSVIATWCYNINHNLEILINDKDTKLTLVYVDDVIKSFVEKLNIEDTKESFFEIETKYVKTLGEIEQLLYKFNTNKGKNLNDDFEKVLYDTFRSYEV